MGFDMTIKSTPFQLSFIFQLGWS